MRPASRGYRTARAARASSLARTPLSRSHPGRGRAIRVHSADGAYGHWRPRSPRVVRARVLRAPRGPWAPRGWWSCGLLLTRELVADPARQAMTRFVFVAEHPTGPRARANHGAESGLEPVQPMAWVIGIDGRRGRAAQAVVRESGRLECRGD